MLWQRLLFGTLLIATLAGLLYADSRLAEWMGRTPATFAFNGIIVTAVVAALVFIGGLELARLFRGAGHQPLSVWSAGISSLVAIIPFLHHSGIATAIGLQAFSAAELTVGVIVATLFAVFALVALRRRTERAISDMAVSLWPPIYLGLLAQFVVTIRLEAAPHGVAVVLYFIATVKICDIGAYFTGLTIGRHKLISWLSPKKTWEGLFGGIATSVLLATAVAYYLREAGVTGETVTMLPPPGKAAIFGLVMAVIGQAGDLLESLIKRDAQSKDSANAIPAFGGVLDILDSILLTAPVAWWILVD